MVAGTAGAARSGKRLRMTDPLEPAPSTDRRYGYAAARVCRRVAEHPYSHSSTNTTSGSSRRTAATRASVARPNSTLEVRTSSLASTRPPGSAPSP